MIVGLLHPGEMGAAVGLALQANGARGALGVRGPQRGDARARATFRDAGTLDALARRGRADPLDLPAARGARRRARRSQGFDGIYVDANAISPHARSEIAALHPRYVDGGIVGRAAAGAGHDAVPLGRRRRAVAELFAGSVLETRCRRERVRAEDGVRRVVEGNRRAAARDPEVARHFDVEEDWRLAAPELVERLPRAERVGRDEGLALGRRDGGDRRHVRGSRRARRLPPRRRRGLPLVISARGLAKRYGERRVFAGVDLDVAAGGFLLVTGPNGSGKTTLLRVLAGLAAPTAGELTLPERRTVGYLGHEPLVYRELTPLENLTLFGRLYRLPERGERIGMLLERFGLWEVRHERVSTFSRGMQQRLGLCRVLLHEPSLLVLDEPYNALDAQGAELLDARLRRAADVGRRDARAAARRAAGDRAAGVRMSYVARRRGARAQGPAARAAREGDAARRCCSSWSRR